MPTQGFRLLAPVAAGILLVLGVTLLDRFGVTGPVGWASTFLLLVLFAAAVGSWWHVVEFVASDEAGITFRARGETKYLPYSHIALVVLSGGTMNRPGLFIIQRPWWHLPHTCTFAPESELRPWAHAGVRVLGLSKRRLAIELQGDQFFEQESRD